MRSVIHFALYLLAVAGVTSLLHGCINPEPIRVSVRGDERLRRATIRAVAAWRAFECEPPAVVIGPNEDDADIEVRFWTESHAGAWERMHNGVPTVALYESFATQADQIIINDFDHEWAYFPELVSDSWRPEAKEERGKFDVESILAHELGHVFVNELWPELDDPNDHVLDDPTATMAPSTKRGTVYARTPGFTDRRLLCDGRPKR